MLANGASLEAKKEINELYGFSDVDLNTLNGLHSKLLSTLPKIDSRSVFKSANSVILKPGFVYDPYFKEVVSNVFRAETLESDLSTTEGVSMFNQWCSDKTDGMIPKMFDSLVPTCFAVASADYFNAKWRFPFDKKDTSNRPFHNETGKVSNVSTMMNSTTLNVCSDNQFTLVQLDYGNKAFRFSIVMPGGFDSDNGFTLSQIIEVLTLEKWNELNQNTTEGEFIIELPKFEINSDAKDISEIVRNMGLMSLFASESLSGISMNHPELSLGCMMQAVKISVAESGTKAASVTTGIMAGANMDYVIPKQININRPFMFIIDESSTGAILYMGAVRSL